MGVLICPFGDTCFSCDLFLVGGVVIHTIYSLERLVTAVNMTEPPTTNPFKVCQREVGIDGWHKKAHDFPTGDQANTKFEECCKGVSDPFYTEQRGSILALKSTLNGQCKLTFDSKTIRELSALFLTGNFSRERQIPLE